MIFLLFVNLNVVQKNKQVIYKLGDSWKYMPPILVPSSATCITAEILVIAKLNGTADFVVRGFVCAIICPSKELPVQS